MRRSIVASEGELNETALQTRFYKSPRYHLIESPTTSDGVS